MRLEDLVFMWLRSHTAVAWPGDKEDVGGAYGLSIIVLPNQCHRSSRVFNRSFKKIDVPLYPSAKQSNRNLQ